MYNYNKNLKVNCSFLSNGILLAQKNEPIIMSNGQYECPFCGRLFDDAKDYEEHYGETHGNWEYGECKIVQEPVVLENGNYQCPIDKRIFESRIAYDQHCSEAHMGIQSSVVPGGYLKRESTARYTEAKETIRDYIKGKGNESYPATKGDIIDQATTAFAPKDVLNLLKKLPDRSYSSIDDVMQEVEKMPSGAH